MHSWLFSLSILAVVITIHLVWPLVHTTTTSHARLTMSNTASLLHTLPLEPLDEAEKDGLIFLLEAAEFAHDVHKTLHGQWRSVTAPINVTYDQLVAYEDLDIQLIQILCTRYGLTIPNTTVGTYTNQELTTLYQTTVATGMTSLENAYISGAIASEIYVNAVREQLLQTNNYDLLIMYQKLLQNAEGYMRLIVSPLEHYGVYYKPTYISYALYEEIIGAHGGTERRSSAFKHINAYEQRSYYRPSSN